MDADETTDQGRGDGRVEDALGRLFRNTRTNALIAWALTCFLGLVLVESVADADRQWIVFVATVGVVAVVPPTAYRDWRVTLPWELLVLAFLPVLARGLLGAGLGTFAYYLSVAGLALLVTVELHMFTSLQLTHWFAVALVVLTTMAAVAAWTVIRWYMDAYLGTAYLSDNDALMIEWLWVTASGLVAGLLFDLYFRGRASRLGRSLLGVIGQ